MVSVDKVETNPLIYIVRGDDDLAGRQFISETQKSLGDASMVEMNTTFLDGSSYSEEDLRSAAYSMPFLSSKRLVILSNPLPRLTESSSQERFLKLLDQIPDTSLIILIIKDTWRYKKNKSGEWEIDWQTLKPNHWLVKWYLGAGGRVKMHDIKQPGLKEMPGWIQKKASDMGGRFEPAAAETLAELVGMDTSLAIHEIEKLLTYVDNKKSVEIDDVKKLTASGMLSNVFDMVDAVSERDAGTAVKYMENLLEQGDPSSLFFMVVRQFRLLLQVREILDGGGSVSNIQQELNQPPFMANKLMRQAKRFSMKEIEAIYHKLIILDEDMKTSRITPVLGINLLVAEICAN
jgi:DNA polymerase III subunit delta